MPECGNDIITRREWEGMRSENADAGDRVPAQGGMASVLNLADTPTIIASLTYHTPTNSIGTIRENVSRNPSLKVYPCLESER